MNVLGHGMQQLNNMLAIFRGGAGVAASRLPPKTRARICWSRNHAVPVGGAPHPEAGGEVEGGGRGGVLTRQDHVGRPRSSGGDPLPAKRVAVAWAQITGW